MEFKKQKNERMNNAKRFEQKSKTSGGTKFQEILEKSVMSNAGYAVESFARKTNFMIVRLMWLLSLILTSSVCFYLIAKSATNYLNYEVVTKINVINEEPSIFPT